MATGPRIRPLDTAKKPHVIPTTSWTNAAIIRERAEAKKNRYLTKAHAQEVTVAARAHKETKQRPRPRCMSDEKAQAIVHGVADELKHITQVENSLNTKSKVQRERNKQVALDDLSSRFSAWRKRQ